jgi:hypothetical protein
MSDVNLDFTVSNNNINFTVAPNDITITPTDIKLSYFGGGLGVPGGSTGQLQYNNGGLLGGVANTSYSAGNLSLGSVANIKITGGTANYALVTDGAGNLSWGQVANAQYANYANYAGNVTIASQPNITSLGTLASLNVTGTANLGSNSNVKITGGTNGYVLSTDGFGALTWLPQAGGSGNGVPGGNTYSVQYNLGGGSFGGATNMTYNTTTNLISVQALAEKATLSSSPATGTVNYDILSQAIVYNTANATANFTLNIRGNSTITLNNTIVTGQSITCTFINTNGATGYYANVIKVDGTTVTPLWFDGVSPAVGTVNGKDIYTFNIIKTAANTFTTIGSLGSFY